MVGHDSRAGLFQDTPVSGMFVVTIAILPR
jgi:hypothetical protein